MTDMNINFHKSTAMWLEGSKSQKREATSLLNCNIGSFPISYLGIPIIPSSLQKQDWQPLINKI